MSKMPSSIRGALRNLKEMFYELIGVSITADNPYPSLTENDKLKLEVAVLTTALKHNQDTVDAIKAMNMIHYGKFRPKSYDEIVRENTVLQLENTHLQSRLSVLEGNKDG